MKAIKVLFSFFIFIFCGILLFFFTYSSDNYNQDSLSNYLQKNDGGLFELVSKGEEYELKDTDKLLVNKYYKDNLNDFDEIFFSLNNESSYKKEINENNVLISIGKGLYFFDLKDLVYNYVILNDKFKINSKSTGKFLIDTTNDSKIKIYSLNSILEVVLLNSDNKEELTKLTLFPHMSFSFNPSRNKLVKNADLLRLSSIFSIGYYENTLSNENIDNFLNSLYGEIDETSKKFLVFIESIKDENYNSYENINDFIIPNSYVLNGISYLNKYFVLLLNNSKKVTYYQNNILRNLNNILKSNQESSFNIYMQDIKFDLDKLKSIDNEEYKKITNLIEYYYGALLSIHDFNMTSNIFAFSQLIYHIKSYNFEKGMLSKSSFLISKLYSVSDSNDKNFNFNSLLSEYLDSYFDENGITLDDKTNSIILQKDSDIISKLDSLAFFLKNVLLVEIDFSDIKTSQTTISILKTYFYINNTLSSLLDNKIESLIVEYYPIVDKITNELRQDYFEEDLDERNLLILKNDNQITKKVLDDLNSLMNLFFTFQQKNNSYISQKNIVYLNLYSKRKEEFNEYFLALDNYTEYSIKYDTTKNTLFTTKTILEGNEDIELSQEKLIYFLEGFNGIDISNMSLKIVNNDYYEITNIIINGEEFSFDLYPKEGNTIDNIHKNGELLNMSYEMDSIKYDMEELYTSASDEERYKYDYRNFFLNIFGTTTDDAVNVFVYNDSNNVEEDKSISIFKRDKLVGDRGDFSILKGVLDIGYNDILVELSGDEYDIKVKDGKYKDNQGVVGYFSSNYIFNENDHYFKDIRIKLFNDEFDGNLILGDNYVDISGNIDIRDFKNDFPNIINQITSTKQVLQIINSNLLYEDISIAFNNGQTKYSFTYNGKEISVICNEGKIISLKVGDNNILNNKIINYTDLAKYLQLIR